MVRMCCLDSAATLLDVVLARLCRFWSLLFRLDSELALRGYSQILPLEQSFARFRRLIALITLLFILPLILSRKSQP